MPVGQITFPPISIAPSIYKISKQKVWSILKSIPNDAWVAQIATTTSRENLISGTPVFIFCGAWVVRHRIFATKIRIL
jgi:hypothetical protein